MPGFANGCRNIIDWSLAGPPESLAVSAIMSPSDEPSYLSGFGNEFATEALPGALPDGRNSPQRAPYGLYAEQLSGTAFTAPRSHNRRSWLYRIRPAAQHRPFERLGERRLASCLDAAPPLAHQPPW